MTFAAYLAKESISYTSPGDLVISYRQHTQHRHRSHLIGYSILLNTSMLSRVISPEPTSKYRKVSAMSRRNGKMMKRIKEERRGKKEKKKKKELTESEQLHCQWRTRGTQSRHHLQNCHKHGRTDYRRRHHKLHTYMYATIHTQTTCKHTQSKVNINKHTVRGS